jgi:hypothetical protein
MPPPSPLPLSPPPTRPSITKSAVTSYIPARRPPSPRATSPTRSSPRSPASASAPACYLLIPAASVEALAQLTLRLAGDPAFLKAADPFWNAPASAPSFERVETSLLSAFSGWPRLTPPPATAAKSKRIFQMRTYESPSEQAHIRKVEMFNSGEFACFQAAGFHPVFFADTLIGSRMPCLTYMLSLDSLDEYNARWDAFRNHPDWKKLSANPRYSYEPIVSNITNLILTPLTSSQI